MREDLAEKLKVLEDNPRFKALFILLLRAEGYKKSEDLANVLGVTSRTVKSDLKLLKEELNSLGISLNSKPSRGYRLEIGNQDLEKGLKEYFQIFHPEQMDTEFDDRVNYIIRRLLSSSKPVKTEQLQDELCINVNNSLHREFAKVKQFFENYGISLSAKPHYGMQIGGAEFTRVIALVRMYKFFDKRPAPEFHINDYNRIFSCNGKEKEIIRRIFFKTISESRIVFSDIYAERFVMYLIYFRNRVLRRERIGLDLPELDFVETDTEECRLVYELVEKLRIQMEGFEFTDETMRFLAYIAIASTDLYRFRDCTKENYGLLMGLAEETRNFILVRLNAYFQINIFDDYTCIKDLLKIMLPISMKIRLGISDDVDLGFNNTGNMKVWPALCCFMERLSEEFYVQYRYRFSERERYLIFNVFWGSMHRIVLPHTKLRLAIIAINGRLSTQQLKFNLQHYFSDYIEKIETKVLYELEYMENRNYDYYLCMEYGKNMNIPYEPIYFADEEMTESEYVDSLSSIFWGSYKYDEILPPLELEIIPDRYRFNVVPKETFLDRQENYEHIRVGSQNEISVYFSFSAEKDQIKLYHFANPDDITLHGEMCFLVLSLFVGGSTQKLKMILNIIQKVVGKPGLLRAACRHKPESYNFFFLNADRERE